ncbi:MAG TPA: hypothetical protein VFN61_01400 [Acidimicrobiales bacterium]|nr:hypothetical protein [Acidimicrobiales bacterium]
MDALSGVGGQWAYGSYPGVSGSPQQPNASSGAVAATAATSSGVATGVGALAAVIAANVGAQSSTQYMASAGYSDVMAALAGQATFSRQALGGNLDLQM